MWQMGLQSTEEREEAGGHRMAAALYEGWWGRGVTGIMGGTCTGGRIMVSPKVTFLSLSRGSFTTVFHGDLGIHQWLSAT